MLRSGKCELFVAQPDPRQGETSLRAGSTVSAEERKKSLRNGDQFCVLSSQILWNRLGLAARFNYCSYSCSAYFVCNKHDTKFCFKQNTPNTSKNNS